VDLPAVALRVGAGEVAEGGPGWAAARAAAGRGCTLVVVEPGAAGDGELYAAAAAAVAELRGRAAVLVAGRPDIAAATGAAGACVDAAAGLPVGVVRTQLGPDKVLACEAGLEDPARVRSLAEQGASAVILRLPAGAEAPAEAEVRAAVEAARGGQRAAAVPVLLGLPAAAANPDGEAERLVAAALAAAPDGLVLPAGGLEAAAGLAGAEAAAGALSAALARGLEGGAAPGPADAPAAAEPEPATASAEPAAADGPGGPAMIGGRGQALKDELRGVLGELEALLARAAPDALEVQGAAGEEGGLLGDALRALDELLLMVIVGEFNSGKSTLINTLLGERVLPEGVVPTTNEVSIIKYAGEGGAAASEREADGLFVWRLPAPLLREVSVVDTPGTNVVLQRQQRLTEDFVPRADLVLFVMSADRPLTDSEVTFLRYIKEWGKKVIFVLNKVDLLQNEGERAEVLDFVTSNAREILGVAEPVVLPVSARVALGAKEAAGPAFRGDAAWARSQFGALEDYVYATLGSGGDALQLKLGTPLALAQALVDNLEGRLAAQIAAAEAEIAAVHTVRGQLDSFEATMAKDSAIQQAEAAKVLESFVGRAEGFIDNTMAVGNSATVASYVAAGDAGGAGDEQAKSLPVGKDFGTAVVQGAEEALTNLLAEHDAWLEENARQQYQYYAGWAGARAGLSDGRQWETPAAAAAGDASEERAAYREAQEKAVAELSGAAASAAGGVSGRALELWREFGIEELAGDLEAEMQEGVLSTVWLTGTAAALVLIATSFLDNLLEDALALTVGGALVYAGLLSVPLKRSEAKDRLRRRVLEFAGKVQASMQEDLEASVQNLSASVLEVVAPLEAAAEAEIAALGGLREEKAGVERRLEAVSKEVALVGSDVPAR